MSLENTWGAFRYNVYIFMGILSTVVGAFILYAVLGGGGLFGNSLFSTYYINMSIFLAFAASYPNERVLLYFFIPIKMKWMGYLYGFFVVYSFITTNWVGEWRFWHPVQFYCVLPDDQKSETYFAERFYAETEVPL